MNTRTYFRLLSTLTALLYSLTIVPAQTSADLTAALPTAQSACNSCPTQTFYDTAANVGAKATPVQNITVSTMPADGFVKVQDAAITYYRVFDVQGEQWIGGSIPSSRAIDLGYLPSGVYYLHLSSKDGEVVSKLLKRGK